MTQHLVGHRLVILDGARDCQAEACLRIGRRRALRPARRGCRRRSVLAAAAAKSDENPYGLQDILRKKAYETVTRKQLANGSIIYLYHPQVLVALTDKVEGYKQMPDGLIRVVGVKVK